MGELGECLLPLGPESFVFSLSIYQQEDWNTENYSSTLVLYDCESWSVKLREGHRLKLFEDKLVSKVFSSKRDEVTRGWEAADMSSFIRKMRQLGRENTDGKI